MNRQSPPGQPATFGQPGADPPGVGPHGEPAGYSPPQPSKATLREIDGKLTWVLESLDMSTKRWIEVLRETAEN